MMIIKISLLFLLVFLGIAGVACRHEAEFNAARAYQIGAVSIVSFHALNRTEGRESRIDYILRASESISMSDELRSDRQVAVRSDVEAWAEHWWSGEIADSLPAGVGKVRGDWYFFIHREKFVGVSPEEAKAVLKTGRYRLFTIDDSSPSGLMER
jgi:hypothetical protein